MKPVGKFVDPVHGTVNVYAKRGEQAAHAMQRVKSRHKHDKTMHPLFTIGKHAALLAFAHFISGRKSRVTGRVSAAARGVIIPELGMFGSILAAMPKAQALKVMKLAGEMLRRYTPFITEQRSTEELEQAGLPEFLADGVHFLKLGEWFKKQERPITTASGILSPILALTPYTAPLAGVLTVGTGALYGPQAGPSGEPQRTGSREAAPAPRGLVPQLFTRDHLSLDVFYRKGRKSKKRAQVAEAALAQMKQQLKQQQVQQQHEAEIEAERQRSEEIKGIYEAQEAARATESESARVEAEQQRQAELQSQAEARAAEAAAQQAALQQQLLAQQQQQMALLQSALERTSSSSVPEELSEDLIDEWQSDGRTQLPYPYRQAMSPFNPFETPGTYWDSFVRDYLEYAADATRYGWPTPELLLADVILNTDDALQRDDPIYDCVGCQHDAVTYDNLFTTKGTLPVGPFFSSSWIKASLADLPSETFGMVNTSRKPFEITLNRNVQSPRMQVSLGHELFHVLNELLKLGLNHEQVHHAAVMLIDMIVPAMNKLTELQSTQQET